MRRSKKQLCIALTIISFIVFASNFGGNLNTELPSVQKSGLTNYNSPNQAVNHVPMYIDGNAALATFITNEGLSGDGTSGFPYLIEDFTIDASTANGIEIRNTDVYLVIQDCTVSGGGSSNYDGINIYDAENINIINNDLTENFNGIYVYTSSNILISGNDANYNINSGIYMGGTPVDPSTSANNELSGNNANYNEASGIQTMFSSSLTISDNTANNNAFGGLFLIYMSDSTVSGNNANYNEMYGIVMAISDDNILSGNLMIGGGITLFSCERNNIDTSNKLNEKSVRYYYNTNDVYLSGDGDVGQVILINCNDSTIEGVDISNSLMGIMVAESYNCLFSENLINDCSFGIYLTLSNGTILSGNNMTSSGLYVSSSYGCDIDTTNKVNGKSVRFYENIPGVTLSWESDVGQVILINCDDSVIEGLSIVDTHTGIYIIDSNDCSISENTIFSCLNGIFLMDSSYNSLFGNIVSNNDNGISISGANYNTITENIIYNNKYGFSMGGWNNTIYYNDIYGNQNPSTISGPFASENQWDDGTTGNYWGDDYLIQNPGATNDGTVWDTPYSIGVDNIDNFPLVNPIFLDEDAPIFISTPEDIRVEEGYTGLSISWTAIDLHPTTYTIEWDGTEVVLATAWIGGIPIIYNIPDGVSKGDYSITIVLLDISGQMAQHTVIFSVGSKFKIPGFPLMTILFSISVAVLMLRRKLNNLK